MSFDISNEGRKRHAIHKRHASHRPLVPGRPDASDIIGLAGETQFAKEFGFEVDWKLKPGGDGGHDFVTPIGLVDIKTAHIPANLPLEVGKPVVDVYVLAQMHDATNSATLLGWAWGKELITYPKRYLMEGGPLNYCMPRRHLRPMSELRKLLGAPQYLAPYEVVASYDNYDMDKIAAAWLAIGHKIDRPHVVEQIEQMKNYYKPWADR